MAAKLKLVKPAQDVPPPPRPLGVHGMNLWNAVNREYGIEDAGGVELLCSACQALDRAESCREQIDKVGEIILVNKTPKEHPLLKAELSNRAFVARSIARLGLDVEAVRSGPGRPPATEAYAGRGFGERVKA